jgi:hypothetical protein
LVFFFLLSLSKRKKEKFCVSVCCFCLDFASFLLRIVIGILLRVVVGVVFIKKDDAAYDDDDDVHCEDASSTPRW